MWGLKRASTLFASYTTPQIICNRWLTRPAFVSLQCASQLIKSSTRIQDPFPSLLQLLRSKGLATSNYCEIDSHFTSQTYCPPRLPRRRCLTCSASYPKRLCRSGSRKTFAPKTLFVVSPLTSEERRIPQIRAETKPTKALRFYLKVFGHK
jgi:hypothetical protein